LLTSPSIIARRGCALDLRTFLSDDLLAYIISTKEAILINAAYAQYVRSMKAFIDLYKTTDHVDGYSIDENFIIVRFLYFLEIMPQEKTEIVKEVITQFFDAYHFRMNWPEPLLNFVYHKHPAHEFLAKMSLKFFPALYDETIIGQQAFKKVNSL
jgi:hypothetical protein